MAEGQSLLQRSGLTKGRLRISLSNNAIYLAFLVIVCALSLLTPAFLTVNNWLNILKQSAIIGIIAIGATFVILSGGIDLSPGSIVALSGVIGAIFASPQGVAGFQFGFYQHVKGMENMMASTARALPLFVPIFAALLVGAIAGCICGLVIAKGRVPPFIATLGMMTMARGASLLAADGGTVPYVTDAFKSIGGSLIFGIPILVYIFLVVFLLAAFVLYRTRFGRHVYAIGGNETSAHVSGLNVAGVKIGVYVLAGTLSGLGGLLLASRIAVGSPVSGQGYELDAIAAVVIGGTSLSGGIGRLSRTILGVLIIGVMSNGLDMLNVSSYYQQIVKGIIIILAVLYDMRSQKLK